MVFTAYTRWLNTNLSYTPLLYNGSNRKENNYCKANSNTMVIFYQQRFKYFWKTHQFGTCLVTVGFRNEITLKAPRNLFFLHRNNNNTILFYALFKRIYVPQVSETWRDWTQHAYDFPSCMTLKHLGSNQINSLKTTIINEYSNYKKNRTYYENSALYTREKPLVPPFAARSAAGPNGGL